MQTKDPIRHHRRHGQIIKRIRKMLPHVGIPVFSKTLIVKPVHLSNLSGFVIAAEDGDAVSKADFEGDEERDRFERVVAAVDVVSHEEVVGFGAGAADAEQFGEVVELAVDVAADCDGGGDGLDVGFFLEDFFGLRL